MAKNDKDFRKQLRREKFDIFHLYVYHNVSNENREKLTEGVNVNLKDAVASQAGEFGEGIATRGENFLFGKKNIFHKHYDYAEYSKTSETSEKILDWASDQPGQSSTTTDANGNQIISTTVPPQPPMPPAPGVSYDVQTSMRPRLMDASVNSSVFSGGTNIGQLYNNSGSRPAGWGDKVVLSPNVGANSANYNNAVSQFRLGITVLKITTKTTTFSIGKDGKSVPK